MTAYCPALDGLRGVAALSILFYHLGHWLGLPFIASNSYLAVDTFFCLSGYVVPLAYSANRAPRLTILTFVQVRLIRLLPLIVLATLISALYVLIRLTLKHQDGHLGELALATMFGFATIPYFAASNVVGGPQLFPLNGPQYTLFFELFINVVWFAVRKRSPWLVVFPVYLISLTGPALFGIGGDTSSSFLAGFPRVAASFSAGVMLYHARSLPRFNRIFAVAGMAFIPLLFVTIVLFWLPYPIDSLTLTLWIGIFSPLIVLSGTAYRGPAWFQGLCRSLGALSYPIYALHYPLFCWFNGVYYVTERGHPTSEMPIIVIFVIAISAAVLIVYDRPARRWLSSAILQRKHDSGGKSLFAIYQTNPRTGL